MNRFAHQHPADVVHKYVQPAERRYRLLDQVSRVGSLLCVLDDLASGIGRTQVAYNDMRACLREFQSAGAADATAR